MFTLKVSVVIKVASLFNFDFPAKIPFGLIKNSEV